VVHGELPAVFPATLWGDRCALCRAGFAGTGAFLFLSVAAAYPASWSAQSDRHIEPAGAGRSGHVPGSAGLIPAAAYRVLCADPVPAFAAGRADRRMLLCCRALPAVGAAIAARGARDKGAAYPS